MKEIERCKDSWGQYVIYVSKCNKYEYEKQDLHNIKKRKNVWYNVFSRKLFIIIIWVIDTIKYLVEGLSI